ncbi:hypothetical protein FJV83_17920 [Mesorhizobium sp. WSM4307]|uniref:IclR family transcriptional regulator domain-containing protein n=1 Tax=unclassified Mesorhizobium TaxID=325217 RepID=UPI000BB0162B|nr:MULTISPECIES: IclR family transcriptional regulator C-terminal domain-containing protein [unclassified Mesorhizobium]PBB22342.1 hypothetical protein CK232_33850 [Mesorhizobium sp. WSM4304]PBB74748.1 hypothetical protein CK227_15825 [Mesorhizobium sp. WSM4308]TRC73070.1 hypothetical protein FJV81_26625 [Mesorhizobium sp. WSM4315]TRC83357.1 hypothetical protein FJV83_17920 [Mesorhizobium sp. WSM4307]
MGTVPQSPKTVTARSEILAEIDKARELGYALCVEQMLIGEIVLASAIFEERNTPIGAVHIVGSLSDWDADSFCRKHAPLAISAARMISNRS